MSSKLRKIIKKINHTNYFIFNNGIFDLNSKIFYKC